MQGEDGKKGGADRQEPGEGAGPKILAKGKPYRQAVFSPVAVLDSRHDQCSKAGEDKNRPIAKDGDTR
jgi:hypothetical protein